MQRPASLLMMYHAWDEMGGASVGSIRQRSGPGARCDFLPLLALMHRVATSSLAGPRGEQSSVSEQMISPGFREPSVRTSCLDEP